MKIRRKKKINFVTYIYKTMKLKRAKLWFFLFISRTKIITGHLFLHFIEIFLGGFSIMHWWVLVEKERKVFLSKKQNLDFYSEDFYILNWLKKLHIYILAELYNKELNWNWVQPFSFVNMQFRIIIIIES